MEVTKEFAVFVLLNNILLASAGNSSLTFVIDSSGSMQDDIDQVRQGARGIMDVVLNNESSQIKDIVLVTFNDPVSLNKIVIKTGDPDELQSALNSIVVHNIDNHDWPEFALSGIELALNHSEPNSYIFVFTDAPAKDYDKAESIKSMCQKARSQIYFILTDYCDNLTDVACTAYNDIAAACFGQVFLVEKKDITNTLEYIKETVKEENTVIKRVRIPENTWTEVKFVINKQTDHVLISVTGRHVRIGRTKGFRYYKVVLATDNNKVYRLNNLPPGEYGLSVWGSGQISVKVLG